MAMTPEQLTEARMGFYPHPVTTVTGHYKVSIMGAFNLITSRWLN